MDQRDGNTGGARLVGSKPGPGPRGIQTAESTERRNVLSQEQKRLAHDVAALPENVHFDKTVFPAMLKSSGVRFNNFGDVEVVLVIPAKHRDQIVQLGYAMRSALLVTIENWRNLDIDPEDG